MSAPARDAALIDALIAIVGAAEVLTDPARTARFRTGMRFGNGPVAAVVRPATLVEQWRVLQACIVAGAAVIMQAANTGLTGGSTPDGDDYGRPMVVINTMRITGLHLIDAGRQVVCLPGTTLYDLERALAPIGREPHSVIGSSCIGASVFGGICNNSGGALIRRGPAYTELALFARVDAAGRLHLVNHLGIALGHDPETILDRVERGDFTAADIAHDPSRAASDHRYADHVRAIDAPSPARFNADPGRLFEASGSAGKVMLLAARLDTFAREADTAVFYIGTNDPAELEELRRDMLGGFATLPVSAEYMHRDAFDIAAVYGKDIFLAIRHLGTDRLPALFAMKARVDAVATRLRVLPRHFSDRVMQAASRLFPSHLPARMIDYRHRFEHHLMLRTSGDGIAETRAYLAAKFPSATGEVFECTTDEGIKAFLHRFAAAGAAIRYRDIHSDTVEDIVALDIALRRDDRDWFETLPPAIEGQILRKLYYGHFFCHVLHQDYVVAKGHDPVALEEAMLVLLDARGAEYPAEHNVGHLYHAKPSLRVNLHGAYFMTQAAANQMVRQGRGGSIIAMSSISALVGGEFQTHYTPTKAGVLSLMQSAAIALGRHGIRCDALLPGTILTDINKDDLADEGKRHRMEQRIPLGRLGQPEDMVGPTVFLASDLSAYVTSAALLVDGGAFVNLQ